MLSKLKSSGQVEVSQQGQGVHRPGGESALGPESREDLGELRLGAMKVFHSYLRSLPGVGPPDDGVLLESIIFYIFGIYPHICSIMQHPQLTL